MAFGLPKTLKDEKIMDSWGMVIRGARGKADYIFDTTQSLLQESEAPDVSWKLGEITPGLIKGLLGRKREYLMVTNEALKDHKMYIGARDYGIYLDVQWYLTAEPGFLKSMHSKMAVGTELGLSFALDIFAQQDLRAYVTVAHHCLLGAVEMVMDELGQDTATINRKSKGFLEVW